MKKKEFKIPIYNYDVTFVEIESKNDENEAKLLFENFQLEKEDVEHEMNLINKESEDGGSTYYSLGKKQFLILIHKITSEIERRNIINHEKRHVEDRLLRHCNINDIESAGYLSGFLSEYLY